MKRNTLEPEYCGAPIKLADFVADIERRRRETGITELPRNAGKHRTASKKTLLKAIGKAGGKW